MSAGQGSTAIDGAFHRLRQMISSGRLGAGEKFPPEAELCAELGVSRGSLREAVRMLTALGVVQPRHGSGVYVSSLRPEELIGTLSLTVDLLPLSGLLEVYELRRVLESHVAGQAAARVTDDVAAELRALIEAMEATADQDDLVRLDATFHEVIARTGGNPTMVVLLGVFRSRSRDYQIYGTSDGARIKESSDQSHRRIAEAVIDGDPARAAAAAAEHVAQTESWLRKYATTLVPRRPEDEHPATRPG
ncbi:MAG TPA: FadR/GntR family transcriptional regulator [Cellulomonas sp.]